MANSSRGIPRSIESVAADKDYLGDESQRMSPVKLVMTLEVTILIYFVTEIRKH